MDEHFINMRSYPLGVDSAFLIASWTSVMALTDIRYSDVDKKRYLFESFGLTSGAKE